MKVIKMSKDKNSQTVSYEFIKVPSEIYSVIEWVKDNVNILGIHYKDNEHKLIPYVEFFNLSNDKILRGNIHIIIDRNILVLARELFDTRELSTIQQKKICGLLIYAMYFDAAFDPGITLYEGGSNQVYPALNDLRKFRIMDNMAIDVLVDLYHNKINRIPEYEMEAAKKITPTFSDETKDENYNKNLNIFRRNYPFMLKVGQILRIKNLSFYEKIKMFFDWVNNEYFVKVEAVEAAFYIFFNNGKIIKNFNTSNYDNYLLQIQNATWDITLITYLKDQAKKQQDKYYLLTTEDNSLMEFIKLFMTTSDTTFFNYFGKQGTKLEKLISEFNTVRINLNREKIVKEKISMLESIITKMENEIKTSFS